jgi:hypothetical protein
MKTVYVVEVSDSQKPVFPDSCVVCGQPRGERLTTIMMNDEHGRVDFYLHGLFDTPAQGSLLEIPAHDVCARGVRNDFLKRFFLIVSVAASIFIIGILNKCSTWLSAAIALVLATPFLYFQFTKPVPVEFNHYDKKYVLMFKDRSYAEEFSHLNIAEVKECEYPLTGHPIKGGPKM